MRCRLEYPLVDDIDDVTAAIFRQLSGEELRQHKGAAQIDLDVIVPGLSAGGLPVIILEQGGGIDQRGQRSDLARGALHQGGGLAFPGQVALQGRGFGAKSAHRLRRAVGVFFRTVVMDRHVPAMRAQVQGDGSPQPLGRAGDKNVFQHGLVSRFRNSHDLHIGLQANFGIEGH